MSLLRVVNGPIGIAAAALTAALAYTVAFVQWRRHLPHRWESLAIESLTLFGGQLLIGPFQGVPWNVSLITPAALVLAGLIAGKGSVAVFYTDLKDEPPSAATQRARKTFGWMVVGVLVGGLAWVLVVP